jgi:hypothetical protein
MKTDPWNQEICRLNHARFKRIQKLGMNNEPRFPMTRTFLFEYAIPPKIIRWYDVGTLMCTLVQFSSIKIIRSKYFPSISNKDME